LSLHVRLRKIVRKSSTTGDCMYKTSYSLPRESPRFLENGTGKFAFISYGMYVYIYIYIYISYSFLHFPCTFQQLFKKHTKKVVCIFTSFFLKSSLVLVKMNVFCMLADPEISLKIKYSENATKTTVFPMFF